MITRLSLRNFQGWESLDLPLSPITVIVGETNAGKSSVLRALACVLYNAIEGTGMVRKDAGKTGVVEVVAEIDGHRVEWLRGVGINRFVVDGTIFDKPGRVVPPEVQTATGVHELEFDGEAVRLQWAPQMDGPFLLADAGAKATRMLGVAGKAAILAQATKFAVQESRDGVSAVNAAQAQVERLQVEADRYSYLDAASAIVPFVSRARIKFLALQQQRDTLAHVLARLDECRSRLHQVGQRTTAALARQQVVQRWNTALETQHRARTYLAARRQVDAIATRLMTLQSAHALQQRRVYLLHTRSVIVSYLRGVRQYSVVTNKSLVADQVQAVRRSYVLALEIRQSLVRLSTLTVQAMGVRARLTEAQYSFDSQRAAYDALRASVTCPTCGAVRSAA